MLGCNDQSTIFIVDLLVLSIKLAFCFKICSVYVPFPLKLEFKKEENAYHEFGFINTDASGLQICYVNDHRVTRK